MCLKILNNFNMNRRYDYNEARTDYKLSNVLVNKMFCGKFEAARTSWETPELVEKLLPFLDLEFTLHLAQTHELTQDILQGSCIWNKLIRLEVSFGTMVTIMAF